MSFPRIPRPDIDLRDAHIYGGLAIAAAGGWQISPSCTAVVVGLVLVALGVFAPRRRRVS